MNQAAIDWSLYLVSDRQLMHDRPLETIVEAAVEGGVGVVQLREKHCSTGEFVALAEHLLGLLAPRGIPLIINDRVDVALAVGAAGVHLGQTDMPYTKARALLGPDKLIGLSVENLEQAQAASALDVDYLGVSPIFTTPTKTDTQGQWGLAGLAELRARSPHRLVAIGGIHADNARAVVAAGADGLAVVSAICTAADPAQAAHTLRQAIHTAPTAPADRTAI